MDYWVSSARRAIDEQDGHALRRLLDFRQASGRQLMHQATRQSPKWFRQRLPEPWDRVLAAHCQCLLALSGADYTEAYNQLCQAQAPLLNVFEADTVPWTLEPVQAHAHNMYTVAALADKALQAQGQAGEKTLSDCGAQLRACFSTALQARGNKAKKLAMLDIINVSFRVYFRLNTLRLCTNLIATVESPQCPPLDAFPIAHRVTYQYFTGRLHIFEEKYKEADAKLSEAFQRCHTGAARNKARILEYLLPVKMLRGQLPAARLLQQYQLPHYTPVIEKLASALEEHEQRFIRAGTYFLLEKLQQPVLRRLLKRVWLVHASETAEEKKRVQLPLAKFHCALHWQGVGADLDEAECIVANLIHRKYVKGYIAHVQRILVLSKQNPFPPLQTASQTMDL